MDSPSDRLDETWRMVEGRLPPDWTLEALRCASTGLAQDDRSDDWIAVALGPRGQTREHRAGDPIAALLGLVGDAEVLPNG